MFTGGWAHADMQHAVQVYAGLGMSAEELEKSCEHYDRYLCEMALLQVQRRNMLDQLHQCYRCDKQAWFAKLESEQLQMRDTLAASAAVEALHKMLQKENELLCDLLACILADVRPAHALLALRSFSHAHALSALRSSLALFALPCSCAPYHMTPSPPACCAASQGKQTCQGLRSQIALDVQISAVSPRTSAAALRQPRNAVPTAGSRVATDFSALSQQCSPLKSQPNGTGSCCLFPCVHRKTRGHRCLLHKGVHSTLQCSLFLLI